MRWPGPISLKTLGELLVMLFVVVATVVFRTREYPWRVDCRAQNAVPILKSHYQRCVRGSEFRRIRVV